MNPKPLHRLSIFFTKPIPSKNSLFPQTCFPFSTPNHPRLLNSFDDVVPGSSAVYHHALKFQRPATIPWRQQLENRVTFIGTVTRQPKPVNSTTQKFGVHTILKVSTSKEPNSSSFKLLLMMWDSVAELATKQLKPNDFIYVSGCLGSYTKPDPNGNLQLNYKLIVKDFDFVAERLDYEGHKKLESIEAEAGTQNDQNRLYLWQVFFANPFEWWDNRKSKLNPKQPDFKHKTTDEALWLSKYDPPWVKKQLQLLDSKISEGFMGRRSRVTTWVYDE